MQEHGSYLFHQAIHMLEMSRKPSLTPQHSTSSRSTDNPLELSLPYGLHCGFQTVHHDLPFAGGWQRKIVFGPYRALSAASASSIGEVVNIFDLFGRIDLVLIVCIAAHDTVLDFEVMAQTQLHH